MNERIRDLLIKSGFATGYDRHQHGHWILSDTEAEKFAELIVQHCKENFAKVWYEQGADICGAKLDKFLIRFDEHFEFKE